jgi:putative ABC transport system substrate-binding protein
VRRRDFLKIAGAFSATAAAAQQSTPPVIGFLSTRGPADTLHLVAAFKEGLKTAGFIVGQNVALEFRWAEGRYDRLPGLANDLVRRNVSVIAATGGEPAALAAKAATQSVPIVFSLGTGSRQAWAGGDAPRPGR